MLHTTPRRGRTNCRSRIYNTGRAIICFFTKGRLSGHNERQKNIFGFVPVRLKFSGGNGGRRFLCPAVRGGTYTSLLPIRSTTETARLPRI